MIGETADSAHSWQECHPWVVFRAWGEWSTKVGVSCSSFMSMFSRRSRWACLSYGAPVFPRQTLFNPGVLILCMHLEFSPSLPAVRVHPPPPLDA